MNFQKIPPVELAAPMLDLAFRKAREKGKQKNLTGNWLQIIRQKETLKIDIVKDTIVPRLLKILSSFPSSFGLAEVYTKLMKLTLDYPAYKQSLGAVNWAVKRIQTLQKEYVRKIVKTKERPRIKSTTKEFYGRISSVLKQINKNLKYLEECRQIMRTYPDIKEMYTVCLYGFPNVGKTTLLNTLTGTKAKTAAYSFTTKSINAGYFTLKGTKVQVLDVPGTLARKEKMNNIELQAELIMKEIADVIIYVFDITEQCGYGLKKQEQLLRNLGKKKKIFIYVSKQDLLDKGELEKFSHKHNSLKEIKEKIVSLAS